MSNTTTTPAVYVGTYHKYNCGNIFGKWFDLTEFDGRENSYEACRALHADEWDAEFRFQDWEGILSQFVSECAIDWDFIAAYQRAEVLFDRRRLRLVTVIDLYTRECLGTCVGEDLCSTVVAGMQNCIALRLPLPQLLKTDN